MIRTDNQAAMKLARSNTSTSRTKFIKIKCHIVRDHMLAGGIRVHYCPKPDISEDGLTKLLPKISVERDRNYSAMEAVP